MSASSLSLWQLAHGERIDSDLLPDWTPAPTGRRVIGRNSPERDAQIAAERHAQIAADDYDSAIGLTAPPPSDDGE